MKIIVADDEFANRLLISEIVKGLGHELVQVENGEQVIHALAMYEDIDLVLMDIEMPVMNGVEAVKRIREEFPFPKNKLPVIAITGHQQHIFLGDHEESDFDNFLTKPYSIEKFTEILDCYRKS